LTVLNGIHFMNIGSLTIAPFAFAQMKNYPKMIKLENCRMEIIFGYTFSGVNRRWPF